MPHQLYQAGQLAEAGGGPQRGGQALTVEVLKVGRRLSAAGEWGGGAATGGVIRGPTGRRVQSLLIVAIHGVQTRPS